MCKILQFMGISMLSKHKDANNRYKYTIIYVLLIEMEKIKLLLTNFIIHWAIYHFLEKNRFRKLKKEKTKLKSNRTFWKPSSKWISVNNFIFLYITFFSKLPLKLYALEQNVICTKNNDGVTMATSHIPSLPFNVVKARLPKQRRIALSHRNCPLLS